MKADSINLSSFSLPADVLARRDSLKGMFIDGKWRQGSGAVHSHAYAANNSLVSSLRLASPEDVRSAIAAAQAAQPSWRKSDPSVRAACLNRLADLIVRNGEDLARLQSLDTGMPVSGARQLIPMMDSWIRYYAGFCDKIEGSSISQLPEGRYFMTREPYGVVAILLTWNMPTISVCMKAMAALAAGNTVVIKSPEMAPFGMMALAELIDQAGFPPGVVNVLPAGPDGGEALVSDPRIGKISFTGGAGTAGKIQTASAGNLVPLLLELGGKSACMIFEDANLDAAVPFATFFSVAASGQGCILPTRMLVHERVYEEVVGRVRAIVETMQLGDPFDEATQYGPVINAHARERIHTIIDRACSVNAGRMLVGGARAAGPFEAGSFVHHTVFADVDPDSSLFRDEIFGPVLAISKFSDEADAIRQANGTRFGLFSYLFTRDIGRALRIADAMEAGSIAINGFVGLPPKAPFGGVGLSGYGKEGAREGLYEFLRTKTIFISEA